MAGALTAPLEAVVLAGGLGTRLRAAVPDRPKCLAPVHGVPFLALLLTTLADAGVRRVVLSTGVGADAVLAAFGERFGAIELVHVREASPLGTGGAVAYAFGALRGDAALVLNGDSIAPVAPLLGVPEAVDAAADCVLGLVSVPDAGRYGRVRTDAEGVVVAFEEKGLGGPGDVNSGVYRFHRRALGRGAPLPAAFSLERDLFPRLLVDRRLAAVRGEGDFIDIGVPDDYARAQALLAGLAARARRPLQEGVDCA